MLAACLSLFCLSFLKAAGLLVSCPPVPTLPASASASPVVLAEDDTWLVAAKPAGITIHEGDDSLISVLNSASGDKLFPVHRLDRETSGIVLVAKTSLAAAELQAALQADGVIKEYTGVTQAIPQQQQGRWSATISNKGEGRRNPRGVSAERVEATTDYRVVTDNGFICRCAFTLPKGGRTHQIRKHAAIAGAPILGDARYGDKKRNAKNADRYGFSGMALHATRLRICIDGVDRTFEAPLPQTWAPLLAALCS